MRPATGINWFVFSLQKYAIFTGRARRKEFWYFGLFYLLFFLVALLLDKVCLTTVIATVYKLALAIPNIAVGVRRLHDCNRSGWWIVCPIVNLVFFFTRGDGRANRFGPPP